jgi:hypothetical protein
MRDEVSGIEEIYFGFRLRLITRGGGGDVLRNVLRIHA